MTWRNCEAELSDPDFVRNPHAYRPSSSSYSSNSGYAPAPMTQPPPAPPQMGYMGHPQQGLPGRPHMGYVTPPYYATPMHAVDYSRYATLHDKT